MTNTREGMTILALSWLNLFNLMMYAWAPFMPGHLVDDQGM